MKTTFLIAYITTGFIGHISCSILPTPHHLYVPNALRSFSPLSEPNYSPILPFRQYISNALTEILLNKISPTSNSHSHYRHNRVEDKFFKTENKLLSDIAPHHDKGKTKVPVKKKYAFDYDVKDANSGANFGHAEKSDGDAVRGSYKVALPDGRIQTVTYTADKQNGFRADVSYEGAATYPRTFKHTASPQNYQFTNTPLPQNYQFTHTSSPQNYEYKPLSPLKSNLPSAFHIDPIFHHQTKMY